MLVETSVTCEQCGKSYRWKSELAGRRVKCKCGQVIAVPSATPSPGEGGFSSKSPATGSTRHFPPMEQIPLTYVASPSIYRPSGAVGDLGMLLLYGLYGALVAMAVGLGCGIVIAIINVVHNLLPVYIFIVSIVLLAIIAGTPAAMGISAGAMVGIGAVRSKCRNPRTVALLTLSAAIVSIFGLLALAELILPTGLVGFIGLMYGGAVNMKWTTEFQAIDLAPGLVYGVLGASGVIGALIGSGVAMDKVKSTPFCERCQRYLDKHTLWSAAPNHAHLLIEALTNQDFGTLHSMPACASVDNRINVDVWACPGNDEHLLELFGCAVIPAKDDKSSPTKKDPVRIFSMRLNRQQSGQLLAIAAAKHKKTR